MISALGWISNDRHQAGNGVFKTGSFKQNCREEEAAYGAQPTISATNSNRRCCGMSGPSDPAPSVRF
jgi:hypothetical protein